MIWRAPSWDAAQDVCFPACHPPKKLAKEDAPVFVTVTPPRMRTKRTGCINLRRKPNNHVHYGPVCSGHPSLLPCRAIGRIDRSEGRDRCLDTPSRRGQGRRWQVERGGPARTAARTDGEGGGRDWVRPVAGDRRPVPRRGVSREYAQIRRHPRCSRCV